MNLAFLRPKSSLTRRLWPLYIAAFTQWLGLWVGVEKLFMTDIGFDAAAIGITAALYAVFVPLIEIPSGILADRWSRRGLLIIASLAAIASALIGGLSFDVPTYIVSALVVGIFFALASGTFEAIVYDTVLEETGSSKAFEQNIGRIRMLNSLGGLLAALAGGVIAAATSPRMTFFLTIPLVAISVIVLLKFREPQLHKMKVAVSAKRQIKQTYSILLRRGKLLPIIGVLLLTSLLVQVFLEFSQLWLIALETPIAFYGVAFALIMSAAAIGGLLAGRVKVDKLGPAIVISSLAILSCLGMIFLKDPISVTLSQVVLSILAVIMSILFTRILHDNVPSEVRGGVASGVSGLSWIVFVPFSLLFGWMSQTYGAFEASWLILGLTAVLSIIFLGVIFGKKFGTNTP